MSPEKNQRILVTGTSTGFGRDMAETLARQGNQVFATMRDIKGKNAVHAQALETLAQKEDLSLHVIELDVTQDTSVQQAVDAILKNADHLDVLLNNAGYVIAGLSEAFTSEQVQAQFNTNVFGIQRMMRAVLPGMRQRKQGLVINISSVVGRVTMPFMGWYGATKFAVEALSDSYRYELAPYGIEVTLIQPSAYPTDIFSKIQNPLDQTVIEQYAETRSLVDGMFNGMSEMISGDNAPNPHDVVEAVCKLITMPAGQRPARTVVGNSFGADALNQQAETVQQQLLASLGLQQLGKTQIPALV